MGSMPRYGSYNPMAQDPVLEARRAQFASNRAAQERSAMFPHLRPAGERDIYLPPANTMPEEPAPTATPAVAPAPRLADPLMDGAAQRLYDSQARTDTGDDFDRGFARFHAPRAQDSAGILAGGDFRAQQPDWGTDVSASQLAIDDDARSDIFQRHARRMQEIQAEDSFRDDPMERAIRRQQQNQEYERNLPVGSRPRMAVNFTGGRDLMEIETDAPGRPTIGERTGALSAIELAQARLNPKDTAEGALGMGRGRLVEELLTFRDQLTDEVRSGRRTREEAAQLWSQASQQAQAMVEMLKSGFPKDNLSSP